LLVNKKGELVFMHKGEMTKADQERFIAAADKLR
jgi:hypothetical protein